MKLIITEKPSVGQAYAKVLGVTDWNDSFRCRLKGMRTVVGKNRQFFALAERAPKS